MIVVAIGIVSNDNICRGTNSNENIQKIYLRIDHKRQ